MNAASWWDATTISKIEDLPEYLHLAPILENEGRIRAWLGNEMKLYPHVRVDRETTGQGKKSWLRQLFRRAARAASGSGIASL